MYSSLGCGEVFGSEALSELAEPLNSASLRSGTARFDFNKRKIVRLSTPLNFATLRSGNAHNGIKKRKVVRLSPAPQLRFATFGDRV